MDSVFMWIIAVLGAVLLVCGIMVINRIQEEKAERERRLREAADRYNKYREAKRRDEELWKTGLRQVARDVRPTQVPPLRKLSTYREPVRVRSSQDVRAPVTNDAEWLIPLTAALSLNTLPTPPSPDTYTGGGGSFSGAGASGGFDSGSSSIACDSGSSSVSCDSGGSSF
jgi:hypothetical protein